MLLLWGSLSGLMLYLEILYHISGFGLKLGNPLFTILVIFSWASIETIVVGCLRGKAKTVAYQIFLWFAIVWTGAQTVYLHIFKQPLLWEAVFQGGQDALTNYWREALKGILEVSPILLLLLFPGVVLCILSRKGKWVLPQFEKVQILRAAVAITACLAVLAADLAVGKAIEANYYEDYVEFFDPLTVAEDMGVHAALQRDTALHIRGFFKTMGDRAKKHASFQNSAQPSKDPDGGAFGGVPSGGVDNLEGQEHFGTAAQAFGLDYEKLTAMADNKKQQWLAGYIRDREPSGANGYTGIFEGYNLIFLTAEGFSPYAVREDLTPTLYRLIHSGFVFDNYYVPLWQTSTSDGEYVNCTGLIPDGQFSMKKSASNCMPYTLAGFFNREGVQSRAYHNNNLSYYARYLTHSNLGYVFKACNPGGLDEAVYGQYLFPMEGADQWPASDYEMMVSTLPEYVNEDRFHVYYMTISGHMYYNFQGNSMSRKNQGAVSGLEMSENARAYIACNMELDKALEYLLEQLKEAGKLESTVIVLSADHYPYAMSKEQYEELAGRELDEGKELFRNNLILWNAAFEEEPVTVHKACGSMDLLPTLLNLFGFDYDSRMYAGRDIFSDEEGMVIFSDRSFVTDGLIYDRKKREAVWLTDPEGRELIPVEEREAYLAEKQQEVRERCQFSAYVLQENFYQNIEDARIRD